MCEYVKLFAGKRTVIEGFLPLMTDSEYDVEAKEDLGLNCWLVRDLRVSFSGMKQSGVGREGGEEALRFFTEPKNVCIAK